MFDRQSFEVFEVDGLDARMVAIRSRIQPEFQDLLSLVAPKITQALGREVYIHIAQHRRRTKYAPESTWAAISTNKRGYKSEPHLQLGIWRDYILMYIAMIDQPKNKDKQADYLLAHIADLQALPADFVYSLDHTKPDYFSLDDGLLEGLERFKAVKKAEFEIGRVMRSTDQLDQAKLLDAYDQLLPLYKALIALEK